MFHISEWAATWQCVTSTDHRVCTEGLVIYMGGMENGCRAEPEELSYT